MESAAAAAVRAAVLAAVVVQRGVHMCVGAGSARVHRADQVALRRVQHGHVPAADYLSDHRAGVHDGRRVLPAREADRGVRPQVLVAAVPDGVLLHLHLLGHRLACDPGRGRRDLGYGRQQLRVHQEGGPDLPGRARYPGRVHGDLPRVLAALPVLDIYKGKTGVHRRKMVQMVHAQDHTRGGRPLLPRQVRPPEAEPQTRVLVRLLHARRDRGGPARPDSVLLPSRRTARRVERVSDYPRMVLHYPGLPDDHAGHPNPHGVPPGVRLRR